MEKSYLEKTIIESLGKKGLVENSRTPIIYKPDYTGESYRSLRRWVVKNAQAVGLGALGVSLLSLGGISIYNPKLAGEIALAAGGAGIAGAGLKAFGFLDRFLSYNPRDVARRFFRGVDVPWYQAYDNLQAKNRRKLDGYVLMAQTPGAVSEEYRHHDYQISLGVSIAKVADTLSDLKADRSFSGLDLEDLIEMMFRQKIGSPEDTDIVKGLSKKHTSETLATVLRNYRIAISKEWPLLTSKIEQEFPGIDVFDKYSSNYEFVLVISGAESSESIGSQISKGHLLIKNGIGPNGCCYAGMHSKGKDFPRVDVEDDAAHSFGTHARRVFAVVDGNAQQKVFEEATGGVVIVDGIAEHNFGYGIDDKNWPTIAICRGGVTKLPEKGHAKNGLIATLDESRSLQRYDPACYIFRNGEMKKIELAGDFSENRLVLVVKDYIKEWVVRRDKN
jgi:hypothetical protein